MELDLIALAEDTAIARAQLSKAHCLHAADSEMALLALASQLLFQGRQVVDAFVGDSELARRHAQEIFSQ
jgi:hypothetical protein